MTLLAVAFGDPGAEIWGAALSPHPETPSFVVLGPEPAAVLSAEVQVAADEWRIVGDGLELTVAPEASRLQEASADIDQMVSVRGQLRGERPREVDCRGCRSERADTLEPGRFHLLREVCAWFGPGEGFALTAVRPRRASGHGDERVTATVFSGGRALSVAEPRLSTTYGQQGQLARTTLELWLAEDEESAKPDRENAVQYPRRAAGEASGPGAVRDIEQLAVQVQPLRWRAEGRDGAGIYLLARAR